MTITHVPQRPQGLPHGNIRPLLTSERIKLTTIRSNHAILGLTIAIAMFVSWATARFVTDQVLTVSGVFSFATVFSAVFAAVAGILSFTSEVEHGTHALSVAARPGRMDVAVAKTISAGLFGVVLGAGSLAAGLAGAALGGIDLGDTSTMAPTAAWATLFTALAAVLGLGIGMISRNSAAAISGLLVWWLVVENLVVAFTDEKLSRYLPFKAGNRLLDFAPDEVELAGNLLSRPIGALVFAGYTFAVLLIGVIIHRRDVA